MRQLGIPIWTGLLMVGCAPATPDMQLPVYGGGAPFPEDENPYEDAEPLPPDEVEGQCGDTHVVDMTLTGYVVDAQWQPVGGMSVWLEERNWTPLNSHGEGVTDQSGHFELELQDLPIVEDCWGIGPQFYVVSEAGTATCEVPANMQLVIAWLDETLEADISGYPCVLTE